MNDLNKYQVKTGRTARYREGTRQVFEAAANDNQEDNPLDLCYVALGLASEAGEFAGKVKKGLRDVTFDRDAAIDELGDILWYVARAATELGVTLDVVAERNIAKLASRQERGVIGGSGDTR